MNFCINLRYKSTEVREAHVVRHLDSRKITEYPSRSNLLILALDACNLCVCDIWCRVVRLQAYRITAHCDRVTYSRGAQRFRDRRTL